MILLNLQLTIQGAQPEPALAATPFLGGVLHGAFEHLVRLHAPAVAVELGMTQIGRQKQYAVFPPPYGWQAKTESESIYLGCGIMLFSQAQPYIKVLVEVLQKWQEIRLQGRRDYIQQIKIYCCAPGHQPVLCNDVTTDHPVHRMAPDFSHNFLASKGVILDLLTPLTLKSDERQTAGVSNIPPKLLRFVRSLVRRIQKLEPDLAASLDLGSLDWIKAEEQIRHAPTDEHQLNIVKWQHGSRTKSCPIHRHGLIGKIHYPQQIPANINALLHWGSWLGVGQSTTMGQGMYTVNSGEIIMEWTDPTLNDINVLKHWCIPTYDTNPMINPDFPLGFFKVKKQG